MRSLTTILVLLLSLSALADRTGVDERIYRCQADKDAKLLGANELFRVHIVAGQKIKITRLSDKKWFSAVPNHSGYYIFEKEDGNFWPNSSQGGYMGDIDKDGEFVISIQESRGIYGSNRMACNLVRVVSELDPLSPTEILLKKIGDDANLANGKYRFSKYNVEQFNLAKEKALFAKSKIKGCTWDMLDEKSEILTVVKDVAEDATAARRLQKLEAKPGIHALLAMVSDNDISCSQRYVWVYTSDGYKLELWYSQGD